MIDEDVDDADDPQADAFLKKLARVDDIPPPDGELRTGDRLARFAIVKSLGAGGMGAVYEAKDETLGRAVALKVMRRASDEARKRFIQEARAAAAVTHPNLIVVHEVGEAEGRAFIVMELIRGRTLRAVMAEKVERDEAVRIIEQVARGVAAAHAAGIVHRDLKPENIMLTDDGSVKVLDFGVARLASGGGDAAHGATALAVTGTGVVIGTPQYMSPEQALGRDVDARSDVYSLGVLATELLTGERPAPAATPVAGRISVVLARCLRADPAERYRNGRELVDALATFELPSQKKRWRPPRIVWVALIAALALGGALLARSRQHASTHGARKLVADEHVKTRSAEARDAYRGAFTALHDSQFFAAVRGFEHAVELDPGFTAAHLRLGLAKRWFHSQEEGRKSFEYAVQHRDDLDARDRALLQAAEPAVMREPYDFRESERRFQAVLKQYPDDFEILYWLFWTYSELGEADKLKVVVDRLAKIDPTSTIVWSARAGTLFYLGDLEGSREAAIECRRVAPTQGTCAFELQKVLDDMGRCEELETVLRAWMIASPDEPRAPHMLATMMLVTRRPRAAVEDMFEQARARLPEAERADAKSDDDDVIAWVDGDFTKTPPDHGPVRNALDSIDIAFEVGKPDEARRVAEQFLERTPPSAAIGTSDADLFSDPTGELLATLLQTGAITPEERAKRRDKWVHELDANIGGTYHRMIWAAAYASPVRTVADAADALNALPRYQPLPTTYWFQFVYGRIGRTFLLGGRPTDALPYLERATQRCMWRDPRDYLYLGLTHEALGDRDHACTAYREVLARWGSAKPRSVTAERARQQMLALGCTP